MKVIDLLNKIANGEEVPKEIIYNNGVYVYDDKDDVMDYYLNEDSYLNSYNNNYYLFENELNHTGLCQGLNEEVEIIEDTPKEDKKIEKMIKLNNISNSSDITALCTMQWENNKIIEKKINEIIDKINGGENE